MASIPVFGTLVNQLPAITDAAEALHTAMAQAYGPARDIAIIGARAILIARLQHLADSLQIVSGVTAVDLAASGFQLRHAATHTSAPPAAPQGVRIKATGIAGELQILLSAVPRAVFYEVEYTLDPLNGPWTLAPAFNSTRGMSLVGLTRGKDYFIRVRAVATGQNRGPWSDIASAMAM